MAAGGQGKCDFRTSNAIKHQQALGTLSAFAAAICEQMQMDSQHEPDAQGAEVTQAFAEVAGRRFCVYHTLLAARRCSQPKHSGGMLHSAMCDCCIIVVGSGCFPGVTLACVDSNRTDAMCIYF